MSIICDTMPVTLKITQLNLITVSYSKKVCLTVSNTIGVFSQYVFPQTDLQVLQALGVFGHFAASISGLPGAVAPTHTLTVSARPSGLGELSSMK